MKEPLEHVLRPQPPWRAEARTECGHEVAEFARVLTREQLVTKVRVQGMQRAALSTCMTCLETCQRWSDWDHDPTDVIARDAGSYGRRSKTLGEELRALGLLYEAHREEYEATLASLRASGDLAAARTAQRMKGTR